MSTPVAIVGMSVLLPGAPDLDTYWRNITSGVDAITDVPAGRWDADYYEPALAKRADRVYCRRGGFVDPLAEVDVMSFGIMPNSVAGTEPDQLIALHVAAAAIADAGGDDWLPADRERVGVMLGRGGYLTPGLARLDQRVKTARQLVRTLGQLMPELGADKLEEVRQAFNDQLGPDSPESAIGLVPNLAASRVANRLDLRGPAYTVDAACASSLVAVDQAVRELADRRCDVVLAGGVHHCHDITLWSVFTQLGALSASQRIRPFHRGADGVLIGEGTGVVVLKRLADAERDGDRVYAVITGTGVASDGRTASLVNPDSGGQVRAVRQAWLAAGVDPSRPGSIGLLEAHGTATPAGDAAELATLAEVFGPADGTDRPVIGSVKSMIGHTMPAAGVAALVKAALAVHHGVLPPTLHCDDPHPALADTRFEPIAAARPWVGELRRAGVNAFGFGGINAHVVLEQAPTSRPGVAAVREPERVLRLSAASPGQLAAMLDHDDPTVLAFGLDEREAATGPTRLGIVDPTAKRLALARKAVAKGNAWRGRNDVWFAPKPLLGSGGGKLAFLFPGLEAEFAPSVTVLARRFGLDWRLSDARVGDIGRHGTGVFQLGRLMDTVLRRLGVRPDAVAGHSVGEWTAMAAGGIHAADQVDAFLAAFDPDALRVPGLAFAVIGAPADRVLDALAGQREVVLSHDNAPSQSMICGPADHVSDFVEKFRADGVISQVLPFQSGFHTPMLAPYLDPIRRAADTYSINPSTVPVWSATTASEYPSDVDGVRELFVRHLLEPVRFRPMIEAMHAAGFRAFVQLGVGQVGSLVGDTLQGDDHLVVSTHSAHRDGLEQLRRVLTALWADGLEPDVGPLLPASPRRAPVRLDLGGALITLDAHTRLRMPGQASALDSLVDGSPLAAELSLLLKDTADVAAELLTARKPALKPFSTVLRVSTDTMPYLLDHCFFQQRPGWPDDVDRWPVVPATTVIHHLMEFAEQAAPGQRAVAVHDVRLSQWITAIPAVDVPVTVAPAGHDRVLASLDGYSRAVIELADDFPAVPPMPWTFDEERVPDLTAAALYSERWMFHGPRFQGVEELTGIGAAHVRATLVTPAAPGALLDNVGQVLGYWIMATLPDRTTVFPVGIGRIRFHGEHPAAGERLECLVRITSVTDTALTADMQLVHRGRVWATFEGWSDRRFDSDPNIRAADRAPGRNMLSTAEPEGWTRVHERWPDLATRELIMRNQLGSGERALYDLRPPRGKRQWLLGRIAAKDAVRRWMWDHGAGDVYPAEIRVEDDHVVGVHGRELPSLTVSIAHAGEVGVAIARPWPCGIAVTEGGSPDAVMRAAVVAAYDAAYEVVAASEEELTVVVDGAVHVVRCGRIGNPPGLPVREYIVAWTADDEQELGT